MNSASSDSSSSPAAPDNQDAAAPFEPPRRSFFVKFLAGAIGFLVGVVPFAAGLVFFLNPLLPKKEEVNAGDAPEGGSGGVQKDEDGFVKLKVNFESLPADGRPRSVKVYDDKVDAWNKFLNVEVGTVWLSRTEDGKVLAFNTVCPHLGCSVDYRRANNDFYCPCHQSAFDLKGEKQNAIPPRNMDALDVKVADDKSIWLKFQNFRGATSEKIPVS